MSDDTRRESLEGDPSSAAADDPSAAPAGEQEQPTTAAPARRDGRPGPDVEHAVTRPPETR